MNTALIAMFITIRWISGVGTAQIVIKENSGYVTTDTCANLINLKTIYTQHNVSVDHFIRIP